MKNLTKFQIVLLAVFVGFIILGVLIFALGKTSRSSKQVEVLVWGTMAEVKFNQAIKESGLIQNEEIKFTYEEKNPNSFEIEFLEALASDVGPDLFLIRSDSLLELKDKALPIPFKSYSEKTFKNSFIEGAEIFLEGESVLALPISVDPLVLYWNRGLFNNDGIVEPPKFWDEFYDLGESLTDRGNDLNLRRSAFALGEFANVNNAFEILSVLIMQAGNPITTRSGGFVSSVLGQEMGLPTSPAVRALSFYTEFSNPLKTFYSWNRSLPWSKNHFLAGDLAIYLGLASELFDIREKNPNLNFDVANLPQAVEVGSRINYGVIEGVAISKKTLKLAEAFKAAVLLSSAESVAAFSQVNNLPPPRRDLLSERPERLFMEVFYDEALIAKPWLVPEKVRAVQIFKEMIESVSGGRDSVEEAVNRADNELRLLLK